MTNFFAGIEISKNHVDFCIADSAYEIKSSLSIPIPAQMPHSKFIENLESGFYAIVGKSTVPAGRIASVAISVPGILNYKSGSVVCSSTIPWMRGVNIKEELSTKLKKFIVMDTEANVRAFIEHKLGGAERYNNFILVLLDPGISAGIYINNRLLRSKDSSTYTLGHVVVEPHGRKCVCARRGCLVAYVSPDAVVRYYLKYKRLTSEDSLTINDLLKRAKSSDRAALNAFYKMGSYLGTAMIDIVNIVRPEAIIFTGRLSKGMGFFLPAVESTLDARIGYGALHGIEYRRSTMESDAVKLGLVHLAKDSYTDAYDLKVCDDIFVI
ncbi:MAG: ROK family protein [Deltaproteobacteria bacterium]|nr:ROK family protein [Deltaproteobacteria bacterium]MCL5277642.1 ROK family protein [Deltaproteobacteria bacterium]